MRPHENPTSFFTSLKEALGVLQMLDVKKDDREVSNLLLAGLPSEYRNLR